MRICDAGGWTDTWFAGDGGSVAVLASPEAGGRAELVTAYSAHGPGWEVLLPRLAPCRRAGGDGAR